MQETSCSVPSCTSESEALAPCPMPGQIDEYAELLAAVETDGTFQSMNAPMKFLRTELS